MVVLDLVCMFCGLRRPTAVSNCFTTSVVTVFESQLLFKVLNGEMHVKSLRRPLTTTMQQSESVLTIWYNLIAVFGSDSEFSS
jgi:hypothetical protein